jgi:hypothetical protein
MVEVREVTAVVFGKDVNITIEATLEKLFKSINLNPDLVSEVILIDDGSLEPLRESIPLQMQSQIQIIRNEKNRGIGDALLIGCQKAKYSSVLFLPGHDLRWLNLPFFHSRIQHPENLHPVIVFQFFSTPARIPF